MAENESFTMPIPDVTLAYLAGMIDADGYISITRSVRGDQVYFGAQVGIAGTRREPHDLASSLWGGTVSRYEPKNPAHRPQYQWSRQGSVAAQVIEQIYPFLRVKVRNAELALELHQQVVFARSEDPFPWFGPDYDPVADMHSMKEEMLDLNQSRSRARKYPPRIVEHNGFPEMRA